MNVDDALAAARVTHHKLLGGLALLGALGSEEARMLPLGILCFGF